MHINKPAKLFQYSQGVKEKQAELQQMAMQLKQEFVGIDNVIDTVEKLMESWRIMPGGQNRPVIITLWGMTGTGKTTLVRRIAQILNSPLIQIDLGEFTSDRNFSLDFYEKYSEYSEKECMILLDEIQNPRTRSADGGEIDREGLRGLWSLLSDGKIIPDKRISKEWYIEELEDKIAKYLKLNGAAPVTEAEPRRGKKRKPLKTATTNTIPFFGTMPAADAEVELPWQISEWTIGGITKLCHKLLPFTKNQIQENLMVDFLPTAQLLLKALADLDVQPQLDYRKTVIFITGNIDEVYTRAFNNNPDITADKLHEESKRITVPDVKNALLKRFRAEQVARLGNNHILYPAFSERNFRDIIQLDLNRINKFVLEDYDINLIFDASVEDLIYKEGVFPTQGARPVLTTVAGLVEASVSTGALGIIKQYENDPIPAPINVLMKLNSEKSIASFELIDYQNELDPAPIFLSIDILRRPQYDNEHISIAIHEAGHTLCQMIEMREIPLKVCAFSPNSNSDGYMEQDTSDAHFDKAMLQSSMVVLLGGWASEKIILGPDRISSGSGGDISSATDHAIHAIQKLGFDEIPIHVQRKSSQHSEGIEYTDEHNELIKKMVENAKEIAEEHIQTHRQMLLEISAELLNKPHLKQSDIKEIINKYDFKLIPLPNNTDLFEQELDKAGIVWKAMYKK
jgi:cell division protease FtsH